MALLRQLSRFAPVGWILLTTLAISFVAHASDIRDATANEPRLSNEIELEFARQSDPYLVIDLTQRRMAVRLKGQNVAEFRLDGVSAQRLADWPQAAEPLRVPTVLHVVRRPMSGRYLQLPEKLRDPFAAGTTEGPAEDSSAATTAFFTPGTLPPVPETYAVETQEGWSLELGRVAEPPGLFSRWWQATRTGWNRSTEHTGIGDRLLLALSPEAAAQLHHLFRPGTPILLVASES